MIIKLSLDGDTPLYKQLKDKIIYAIASGELKENEGLPSVRQLGSSLSINLHTVSKAYTQLADEGFITIRKAKGAVVNSKDTFVANDENINKIKDEISIICAEAKCRSIDFGSIMDMCRDTYIELEGKKIDK